MDKNYNTNLLVGQGPHIHTAVDTQKTMLMVIGALIPALAVSTFVFGPRVLVLAVVCVAASMVFEALWNILMHREQTVMDFSAALTGTVFVFAAIYYAAAGVPESAGDASVLGMALFHILAGGVMLGAIFMATDYVTTPQLPLGKVIFGIGCGLITMIIRLFGAYPEGVSFSILLMNILTPLIDTLAVKMQIKKYEKKEGAK